MVNPNVEADDRPCLQIGATALSSSAADSSMYRGHYMYRQFNTHKFYVLPTQDIYVYYVDLRTNSDYFPIQH